MRPPETDQQQEPLETQETIDDKGMLFRERQANKNDDCRLWTVRDALVFMVREIDEGRLKPDQIVAVYRMPNAREDGFTVNYIQAGVTRAEHIAMIELHKAFYIESCKK